MNKENVLEIEFVPVLNKWAWKITKQDEKVLKFGCFRDYEIGVSSTSMISPSFVRISNFLFLKAHTLDEGTVNICDDEIKNEIEEKVKIINEKYGIVRSGKMRSRETYFYMNDYFKIVDNVDYFNVYDDLRHELGNYFKTITKIEKVMRIIAALTFIITGLYYINIYLKIV